MSNVNCIIMKKVNELGIYSQEVVDLAEAVINQYGYSKGPVWFIDQTEDNISKVAEQINSPLYQISFSKVCNIVLVQKCIEDWWRYYAVNNLLIKQQENQKRDSFCLISDFIILRELEKLIGNYKGCRCFIGAETKFGNNNNFWDEKGRFGSLSAYLTKGKDNIPRDICKYNHIREFPDMAYTYNYQTCMWGGIESFPLNSRTTISDKDEAMGYIGVAYPCFNQGDHPTGLFSKGKWDDVRSNIVLCQKLKGSEEVIPRLMYYLLEDISQKKKLDRICRPSSSFPNKGEYEDIPLPYPKVLLSQYWQEGKVFFPAPATWRHGSPEYQLPPNFPNHKIANGGYPIKLPQAIIDMANTKELYWHRLCPPEPWKFHWWDKQGKEHLGGISHASIDFQENTYYIPDSFRYEKEWVPYFSNLKFNL